MKRRLLPRVMLLGALALGAFGVVRLVACPARRAPARASARAGQETAPAQVPSPAPAAADLPELQREVVEIYFPSAQDDGLVAETREIFATASPGDRAKQIVADLISGPTTELALRALPHGTRLRQIYVLAGGVAYTDFSQDLREGIGGGSAEELLTVYSIVDSVVLNVPEITRVGLLIDGEVVESLNGHLDLRRPLPADASLIVGRIASLEEPPRWATLARAARSR